MTAKRVKVRLHKNAALPIEEGRLLCFAYDSRGNASLRRAAPNYPPNARTAERITRREVVIELPSNDVREDREP